MALFFFFGSPGELRVAMDDYTLSSYLLPRKRSKHIMNTSLACSGCPKWVAKGTDFHLRQLQAFYFTHYCHNYIIFLCGGVQNTVAQPHYTYLQMQMYQEACSSQEIVRSRSCPGTCAQKENTGLFMQMCDTNSLVFHTIWTVQVGLYLKWCGIVRDLDKTRFCIFLM